MRVGCSPAATRPPGNLQSAQPAAEKQAARVQVVTAVVAATQAPAPVEAPAATVLGAAYPAPNPGSIDAAPGPRKIIKDAMIKLQVEDTDVAIDRTMELVGDLGGYILSSRIWYPPSGDKNYKYATPPTPSPAPTATPWTPRPLSTRPASHPVT